MRNGKVWTFFILAAVTLTTAWLWRASRRVAADAPATEPVAATDAARAPVLVELFTSEGCSSCPPADEVLQELERAQPVKGAEIIPLSLHVDYWNYIGWADPFSSAAYSERQNGYAQAFARGRIYTPQMVVDGRAEFVGSDETRAQNAVRDAAQQPKAVIVLQKSGPQTLSVKIEKTPAVSAGDTAEVVLAITESGLRSSVSRGENAGRRLTHTAVTRQLAVIGSIKGAEFTATPAWTPDKAWQRDNLRAVVFVQERRSRRVLGAGSISLK
jgi:hypothetical protein